MLQSLKRLFTRRKRRFTLEDIAPHVTEIICGPNVSMELVRTGTVARLEAQVATLSARVKQLEKTQRTL